MRRSVLRKGTAAALAAVSLLSVSACASTEVHVRSREGAIAVPARTPSLFVEKATWVAPRPQGSPVAVTSAGVLAVAADSPAGAYSVAMLNSNTGEPVWSTRPVTTFGQPVTVGMARQGDRSWVVVAVPDGLRAHVYAFDPFRDGFQVPASTSVTFEGAAAAPVVTVSDGGVLVEGAVEAPTMQYRPDSRTTTALTGVPDRNGSAADAILVHDDGFLVGFAGGGFAYVTERSGWDSAAVAPAGVGQGGGEVVAVHGDFMLVKWPGMDAAAPSSLWLHSLRSGAALVRSDVSVALVDAQKADKDELVVSEDGQYAAWGEVLFDLGARKSVQVGVAGVDAQSIYGGVLYGSVGAVAAAYDVREGRVIAGDFDVAPVGFTVEGRGVFTVGSSVFAVNRK